MATGLRPAGLGRSGAASSARSSLPVALPFTRLVAGKSIGCLHHDGKALKISSICKARNDDSDESPDWEKEMSIFNKRISAPNQLATLRELEAKVAVGKVLFVKDSLAIISGLNADAPLGTKLTFVTGGIGVLLWHRSDNLSFALILGGASMITVGTGVECKIKGVLQVIDDTKGPITKKEFELFDAPAGDHLFGRVSDFLGGEVASSKAAGSTTSTSSSTSSTPGGRGTQPGGTQPGSPSTTGREQGSPEASEVAPVTAGVAASAAAAAATSASTSSSGPGPERPATAVGLGGHASTSGRVVAPAALAKTRPLLNTQVVMKNREQINEALQTGVKALDLLTPIGRGASMLLVGPDGSGFEQVAEDAIIGQKDSDVCCVYASTRRPLSELSAMRDRLKEAGVLGKTALVAADPEAPLGEQYATLCTALAIGERVRDKGGHCLVILDDGSSLARVWETLAVEGLGSLGQQVARQGLVKDAAGNDVNLPVPEEEQGMVEYEGMLVSGAVAQRRGFFSTLLMRPAKMARVLGGGSLTGLIVLPGRPATGVPRRPIDLSKYSTLSEEQKAKLQAALEAKARAEGGGQEGGSGSGSGLKPAPGELSTETVEELISISDGQLVLEARKDSSEPYKANYKLSITRIGSRAFPRALESLAPQIRLGLAQAEDARRLHLGELGASRGLAKRDDIRSARMAAALTQAPGKPASLEEQVVTVIAVQRGYTDWVDPDQITKYLTRAFSFVQAAASQALSEIRSTRMLTAAAEKGIETALKDLNKVLQTQGVQL